MKENRTGAQIIEFLTKRVNALGAKQCGTFLVDCETYASIPQLGDVLYLCLWSLGGTRVDFENHFLTGTQRTLHVFHNSEQPASVFAILDNGNGKSVPVVADGLFDLLLLKMSSVYTSKKSKVEIRGPRFELNDFVIKIGAVNINHNVKGIIVEVRIGYFSRLSTFQYFQKHLEILLNLVTCEILRTIKIHISYTFSINFYFKIVQCLLGRV